MPERRRFTIEDAELRYRNFSGAPTRFKPEGGVRSFNVVLEKHMADVLAADGWNVRCKLPDEEDAEEICLIEVKVGYKVRPPNIVVITDSSGRRHLTEENVGMLDWVDIRKVDLIAQEYAWDVGGKTGITAYLTSMYITIEEDELERKYGIGDDQ